MFKLFELFNFNKTKEKDYYKIPRNLRQAIPVKRIYEDGIFEVSRNKYSKTYKFTDINFAVASETDKENMFLSYSEILNSLDVGAIHKITIANRKINKKEFNKKILMQMNNDNLDVYRKEYNKMLLDKTKEANGIMQEKYITIVVDKNNIDEARNYFSRVYADLMTKFNKLGSKFTELTLNERLKFAHDFYRVGEESNFSFDIKDSMRKGHDFRDYICPDVIYQDKEYLKIGKRYARVLILKDYANYIKDTMVAELTDLNKNMILSIDIEPVSMDVSVNLAERKKLGVESNIAQYTKKQIENYNINAEAPYDLQKQSEETKDFLNDLIARDQKMFYGTITIVHTAETLEELNSDTESIETTAKKYSCQMKVLNMEQLKGLNTAMPYGVRYVDSKRTLTTESLSIFNPFRVQEVQDNEGIYYGQNVISKNMIIADRRKLQNANSFILGVSGSGKSFISKEEIVNIRLKNKNADIIIIDPEREDTELVKALGGEVINISSISNNHINPFDIDLTNKNEYSSNIKLKSEFMMSLCSEITNHQLTDNKQSVVDRCVIEIYKRYEKSGFKKCPTLIDFRQILLEQKEGINEARDLALSLELFTNGSLDTFAKQTNVNTKNSLLCYDLLDLGKQLEPAGMLIVLDSIQQRIKANRKKARETLVFIDEIHLLFKHLDTAVFLESLWKRVRKYNAAMTGITQNVEDLLHSDQARNMLSNSEFIIMLNQSASDRDKLADLLQISDTQLSYITNSNVGAGLLKIGANLIPFENKFPTNTKLYKMMTTKVSEIEVDSNET